MVPIPVDVETAAATGLTDEDIDNELAAWKANRTGRSA